MVEETSKKPTPADSLSGLRIKALDLVDRITLDKLRRRSDLMGLYLIGHAWAVIFGAMAVVYAFPNPLTVVLAVMIIGARQLGLAILMHDAAHNALMNTSWLNDRLSNWLCAYPIIAHTGAYRRYHMQHHARTQQEDDPDLVLSKPFPITQASFKRKMIRDLTGQTALQQRIDQFKTAIGPSDWPVGKRLALFQHRLGASMAAQIVIFALCAALFNWSFYFLFWLLPFFTYQMAITRIRNIAEHAIVPDNNDPFRNARTTHANWLERIFIAPYWVNYHVEHHLLFYVPCYRLPALHIALADRGLIGRMETATGYLDIIRRATSRDDSSSPTGGQKARSPRLRGTMGEGFNQT